MRISVRVECRLRGIPDVRHPDKVECWPDRMAAVICPGGMLAGKNSGCDMSGWNVRWGRIPDAMCPGGMTAGGRESGCEMSG